MVMTVLLKLAFTCATPDVMFFRSRRRGRGVATLPMISYPSLASDRLLLAGDGLGRPLAGARIGMSTLAAHWQPLAMAQAAIAAEIHQPLDVHCDNASQVALDPVVPVDHLADPDDLVVRQLVHAAGLRNPDLRNDFLGFCPADPMDIGQPDQHPLLRGDVDASNTRHAVSSSSISIRTSKNAPVSR